MKKLTHVTKNGSLNMVNVSEKIITTRYAKAQSVVKMSDTAFNLLIENKLKKGDALTVAKIAGVLAAKKCSELIPLAHNILLNKVEVNFEFNNNLNTVNIISEVYCEGKTGVEMEALTAASISALTLYDMLKAVDKSIEITDTFLLEKTGGKSGNYKKS